VAGAAIFAAISMAHARGSVSRGAPPPPVVEGEDEVDPAERRRLDVYWAAAWGALIGRQLAVVNLAALTAPGWPLIFRVLNQVDLRQADPALHYYHAYRREEGR